MNKIFPHFLKQLPHRFHQRGRLTVLIVLILMGTTAMLRASDPIISQSGDYSWPKAKRAPSDPAISVPSRFKNTDASQRGPAPVSHPLLLSNNEAWWTMFHDPALNTLEKQALAANQDLNQAVANIVETRQQAHSAAANFFPQLNMPLSGERLHTTGTGPITESRIVSGSFGALSASSLAANSFAGQQLANTYNDFQGAITASYEVDVFGRIRHTYGEAVANAQASAEDRRAVELSLNADVAGNYFALRALDSQVAVLRHTLALRQEAVQLQQKRLQTGNVSQLEVAQAEVELANTEADLTDGLRERAEQENTLALLCGQPASSFSIKEAPLGDSLPPSVPASLPSTMLTRRPDIVEAERKLAAATEGIGAARAEFFPTVNIQGSYGTDTAQFDQSFNQNSEAWSFGLSVNVPLFEGGRNAANLRAARARRDAAFASYQQASLKAFQEVEDALVDLRQRASQAEARKSATVNAKKVADLSKERYDEGAISYFDVIDSQRLLLNAELNQVQTLNARYAATIGLIRAIGGSY